LEPQRAAARYGAGQRASLSSEYVEFLPGGKARDDDDDDDDDLDVNCRNVWTACVHRAVGDGGPFWSGVRAEIAIGDNLFRRAIRASASASATESAFLEFHAQISWLGRAALSRRTIGQFANFLGI